MSARHVLLSRPGDVLLIGNVGAFSPDEAEVEALRAAATAFRDVLGVDVVLFEADIDMDMVPGGCG